VREPQVMGTLAATAALLAVGVLWTTNDGTKAGFVASEQTWHGTGRLDDSLDNLGPALQEIGVRPMRQTRFDSSAHEFLVQTADIAAALAKMTRAVFDEWIVRLTKATAASRENAKALKRRQQQRQHGRGRDDGMGM